jgi:SAM-dependent methyltransferase
MTNERASSAGGADRRPAHEAAARRDWPAYFDRMVGKPARETLVRAADALAAEGFGAKATGDAGPVGVGRAQPWAADLGCGDGRDTAELLRRGWRVWAQDSSADGLARLRARPECAAALGDGRLLVVDADFAAAAPPRVRLVNASFALPFCPPGEFAALWARIDGAIERGGRFAGQFFGDRDDWAVIEDRTHLTRGAVIGLFEGYVLEWMVEEDRPSAHAPGTPEGQHKHWHVFHVVARKR